MTNKAYKNYNDENAEDSDDNNAKGDNDLNTEMNGDDDSIVKKGKEDENTDIGGEDDSTGDDYAKSCDKDNLKQARKMEITLMWKTMMMMM